MGKCLQSVVFFYVPTHTVSIVSCAQCGQIENKFIYTQCKYDTDMTFMCQVTTSLTADK
jgi:hypothetical protein